MNGPIKNMIEFYLNRTEIKANINNLKFENNHLLIDKISLKLIDNAQGEISDFKLNFNVSKLISNSLLSADFNVGKFSVVSSNDEEIINTELKGNYNLNILKKNTSTVINLLSIKSDILSDKKGANLPTGYAQCLYKTQPSANDQKQVDCKLEFGRQAFLSFNSLINNKNIIATANAANLPLVIYQTIEKIIPSNPVILYLQQHIKQGYIQNGEININLDKQFFENEVLDEEALKANLHISNFEYKYDKDFPPIKNIDTNIIVSGSEIKFLINEAYSGKTPISNGIITFKWAGLAKSEFVINATAQGEIIDLIDFIPNNSYENLKSQNIDLKKIKGSANSIVEIVIPINPDIENTYNISSTLTNISLDIFNNNILVHNGEAKGSYKDHKLTISGKAKINDYPSTFIYDHNLANGSNDCILKIKSNIIAANKTIGVVKLLSGNTVLNLEYKKNKKDNFIIVNSNLNNLEFYIDKIAIYKKLYKKADLVIKTNLAVAAKNIEFSLLGEDNLNIKGNALIKNDTYNINLPNINHAQTNLQGKITLDTHNLLAEFTGNKLDLSNSNMMQFLEKEGDSTRNISLKAAIAGVKLKNNIALNNFNLNIKCDKVRCFTGNLDAEIDNKKVKMRLTAKESYEQWVIDTDNAGSLLKGIGLYNNMKNGTMQLMLNTRRYKLKKGEVIPILDGKFSFNHFIITDNPFLTRIVSFVSLPGFISSIVNNKNILFEDMNGKFNYRNNVIILSDAEAHGPFFDFTMKGDIDTKDQKIKLKGNVIPSFFLISNIITKIPVVGKIFSKVAPYSFEAKY